MRQPVLLFCALLGVLPGSAFAAPNLTITLDAAAAGPGEFAAAEIRREAAARGLTVVVADANSPAAAIRISLAIAAPAGTKAVAESYGIRMHSQNGERTVTVRGADAAGVMYGGLDYQATVWVNDTAAGTHTGGNLPFSFDITSALKPGANTLTVRVTDATAETGTSGARCDSQSQRHSRRRRGRHGCGPTRSRLAQNPEW